MENINYQETIVIPTLQRKLQELTNANLVFEISLLVEQTKNKDMQSFYTSRVNNRNVEDELASKDRLVTNIKNDVKTLTNELNMIKSSLKQETSLKESIIEEYKQYCNKNTEDSMIKEKLVSINTDEIKTLADELNAIKEWCGNYSYVLSDCDKFYLAKMYPGKTLPGNITCSLDDHPRDLSGNNINIVKNG
jgi:hypothetical protein